MVRPSNLPDSTRRLDVGRARSTTSPIDAKALCWVDGTGSPGQPETGTWEKATVSAAGRWVKLVSPINGVALGRGVPGRGAVAGYPISHVNCIVRRWAGTSPHFAIVAVRMT